MQKQNPLQRISIILLLVILYTFSPQFIPDLFSENNKTCNIKVLSRADKKKIGIGEELRYRVSVYSDTATELEMPTFKEIGNFQVKDSGITKRKAFGKKVVNAWYLLIIYETGEQIIPGINIRYKIDEGLWQDAKSQKINIFVQSIFERSKIEADIKPIEPPVGLIFPYRWHVVIGSILFIAGAYFILVLVRKRKKVLADRKGYATQNILFYNQLYKHAEIVSKNSDIGRDDFIELADLVKKYLGSVLRIGNYEFTTEEFLNMVRGRKKLFDKYGEDLSLLLRVSDLAKFANHKPKPEELKEAASFIDNLIHDLTP